MCIYILTTFNPREHTYYDLAEEAFASNSLSNYYLLILASHFTMPGVALCLSIWTKQTFKQPLTNSSSLSSPSLSISSWLNTIFAFFSAVSWKSAALVREWRYGCTLGTIISYISLCSGKVTSHYLRQGDLRDSLHLVEIADNFYHLVHIHRS